MTRAEYKLNLEVWKLGKFTTESDLYKDIVEYEWRHGLRYVVWRARDKKNAGILREARERLLASNFRTHNGVRITRAVRKPKGSP